MDDTTSLRGESINWSVCQHCMCTSLLASSHACMCAVRDEGYKPLHLAEYESMFEMNIFLGSCIGSVSEQSSHI